MIFGNVNSFAIEAVVKRSDDQWLNGQFCYVVAGRRVGNWNDGCSISDAIPMAEKMLCQRSNRRDPLLIDKPLKELFTQIDDGLYRDIGQSDSAVEADFALYWRFQAALSFDAFDGWKCYLVEDDARGRFMYRHHALCEPLWECWLDAGEFDAVLSSFYAFQW